MLGAKAISRGLSSFLPYSKGLLPKQASLSLNTAAKSRLSSRITAHLNSNRFKSPEKMPRAISKFITHHPWTVTHLPGSHEVCLDQTVDARAIDIRWSIIPSSDGSFQFASDGIPFTISISDKLTPQGMIFRCRTQQGGSFRFNIDRVGCYSTFSERDSLSSYPGPHFATLEPELQIAFDEVLHSWGMNAEVIEFIEASSQYYNNSEYISWLCNINDFISK